ncbi:MAG: diguanylate cyclase [Zetaproteobacteria bacterium]|nr:diguanylate cyclase [Zetaproteobacteria bacterium]
MKKQDLHKFSWKITGLLLCLAIGIAFPSVATANPSSQLLPLTLSQTISGIHANQNILYLEDPLHQYTITDIQKPAVANLFKTLPHNQTHLGLTKSDFWLLLNVHNPTSETIRWYLEFMQPQWDWITIYIDDQHPISVGDHTSWREQQLPFENNTVEITTLALQQQQILIHFSNASAIFAEVGLRAWTQDTHAQFYSQWTMLMGLFIGISITLFLYNLFIGYSTRMHEYLWYTIYALMPLPTLFALTGIGNHYVWGNNLWFNDFAPILFSNLLIITACQFSRTFLHTKERSPWSDRFFIALMLISTVSLIIGAVGFRMVALQCLVIVATISLTMPLFGIWQYLKGYIDARFYIAAWSAWSLSIFIALLRHTGVIHLDSFVMLTPAIGLFIEGILLSFALADRINILQHDKLTLQNEQLIQLENEHERLETKVKERTLALEQARQHAESLARTDALTGVANRRALFEAGDRELQRSLRYDSELSAMMIDIDFFKLINDRYGHAGGDAALIHVATLLAKNLRQEDFIGRIGGEEFAIVLPHTSLASATIIAERMRNQIERSSVIWQDQSITLTASFGLAQFKHFEQTEHENNFDTLLSQADSALYQAKKNGRNRIEHWSHQPRETV